MEGNLLFFLYIFLFFFGASVGSFLNVLIDRLPRGEQVLKGRSYCDHCHHKLSWRDLFPLFSWIFVRGRCRYCQSPISGYYPTVEFLTGIMFVSVTIHLGGVLSFLTVAYYLFVISALIVIFFADLKYRIIPDQVVFLSIIAAILYQILNLPAGEAGSDFLILNPILSAIAAGLFFLAVVLITRGRGMGLGDVKLAFLMGLILGYPKIIVALYLAFLTGAFFGVILILIGKKRFGEHIPFGPFLVGGTYVSLFWGQPLWLFFQKIIGIF